MAFEFSAENVAPSNCNAQKCTKRAINAEENLSSHWRANAHDYISKKVQAEATLNVNKAKNIIMFLGDGMSLQTVAATRMYIGGEELNLSFEKFPHFGLAKVSHLTFSKWADFIVCIVFVCDFRPMPSTFK